LLTSDGAVYSFGTGLGGQLGLGDDLSRISPQPVDFPNMPIAVQVAAGDSHALFLLANGALFSTGENEFGQLGHGDQVQRLTPFRVGAIATSKIIRIEAGGSHSIIQADDFSLYSFGKNAMGQLGLGGSIAVALEPTLISPLIGTRIVQITCGAEHSAVLESNGILWTFGNNLVFGNMIYNRMDNWV
jgi:alpha-tubulin suppressor-like RCC1 family protein